MTMELEDRAAAFLSAALRHVRDAEHLADTAHSNCSLDQAYHLAGYGPECARKATLTLRWFDKVIGHQMGGDVESLLALVVSLDPWAARYDTLNWEHRFKALAGWNETCRYERTGSKKSDEVRDLVRQAREVVDELALALFADGRVSGGFQ